MSYLEYLYLKWNLSVLEKKSNNNFNMVEILNESAHYALNIFLTQSVNLIDQLTNENSYNSRNSVERNSQKKYNSK